MLDFLKNEIEEAAFMLVDDVSRKEIHSKLINCLVILGKLESDIKQLGSLNENIKIAQSEVIQSAYTLGQNMTSPHIWPIKEQRSEQLTNYQITKEVNKVSRRLKLWVKRQDQFNAQILNAFLDLKRTGQKNITEEDINSKLGSKTWFWPNFVQMKTIADRNHGKIFDVTGHYVEIWMEIEPIVKEYEKAVFSRR